MTRSVPSPKTFFLIVKVGPLAGSPWALPAAQAAGLTLHGPVASPPQGDQADHARYSVTQVTVEARNATESLPRFPASLYRGTVALGSATGTVVQDAAEPSLPLRVWAQDPDFPVGTAGPGSAGPPSAGGWGAMREA